MEIECTTMTCTVLPLKVILCRGCGQLTPSDCVVDLFSQCCHYSSGANRAGKQIPLSVLIASQSSVMSVHAVCKIQCSCSRDVRIKESDVIIAYFMTSWRVSAVFGASFVVGAQSWFALKHSYGVIRHLSSH